MCVCVWIVVVASSETKAIPIAFFSLPFFLASRFTTSSHPIMLILSKPLKILLPWHCVPLFWVRLKSGRPNAAYAWSPPRSATEHDAIVPSSQIVCISLYLLLLYTSDGRKKKEHHCVLLCRSNGWLASRLSLLLPPQHSTEQEHLSLESGATHLGKPNQSQNQIFTQQQIRGVKAVFCELFYGDYSCFVTLWLDGADLCNRHKCDTYIKYIIFRFSRGNNIFENSFV